MKQPEELDKYPFLRAGLEDIALVSEIVSGRIGSPRHAVCLMHDAIEFALYETLQHANQDIYISGQKTIGLHQALSMCRKFDIDIPLIGTIREIQKHRGDAKHHAQIPHEKAYQKMIAEFRIVISRIIHEQFGKVLEKTIRSFGILPYHTALYDSYRKYRTHNWDLALRFSVGALLHKHRSILEISDDFITGYTDDVLKLLNCFEADAKEAIYPPAPENTINFVHNLPVALRDLFQKGNIMEASEQAGQAYSRIDEIMPSIFEMNKSHILTPRFVQPRGFKFGKGMSWSKWRSGDTKQKGEYNSQLQSLLNDDSEFVARFGRPYYEEDDDRFWKWWEFAVFDGQKWHTFHLDNSFSLSLESGSLDDASETRERVAKLILDEFIEAIRQFRK